jgi:hypothetical protein
MEPECINGALIAASKNNELIKKIFLSIPERIKKFNRLNSFEKI